jgi:hypothetical protein
MLEIGPCDYTDELRPLAHPPAVPPAAAEYAAAPEKGLQHQLLADFLKRLKPARGAWAKADDAAGEESAKTP